MRCPAHPGQSRGPHGGDQTGSSARIETRARARALFLQLARAGRFRNSMAEGVELVELGGSDWNSMGVEMQFDGRGPVGSGTR